MSTKIPAILANKDDTLSVYLQLRQVGSGIAVQINNGNSQLEVVLDVDDAITLAHEIAGIAEVILDRDNPM